MQLSSNCNGVQSGTQLHKHARKEDNSGNNIEALD
uniref:Uncharacterized protein n=1 Tax=Arundo donax TaxID=35708 RepID=A0A0A9DP11_ARUDO